MQGTDTTHGDISCSAKAGEVCKTTNGNGISTTYGYDASGNLTSTSPPAPLAGTSRTPDGLGRTATYTDGKSQKSTYTYDKEDRVTQILFGGATSCVLSSGNCITYSYDGDGNLIGRNDSTGGYVFNQDHLNRTTSEQLGGTTTSSVTYDQSSNVLSYTDAGGTVTYNYDAGNNLLDLNEPGGSCPTAPTYPTIPNSTKCTGFKYDNDNNLKETDYPSGESIVSNFDNAGRMLSTSARRPSGTTFDSRTYTYETSGGADSDLMQTEATLATTYTYTYSNLNQLTLSSPGTTSATTPKIAYTYDGDGNLTKTVTTTTSSTTNYFGYNNADQLCWSGGTNGSNGTTTCPSTPTGDTAYTYDADGNQTAAGGVSSTYNSKNQTNLTGGTSFNYADAGQSLRTNADSTSYVNGLLGLASQTTSGVSIYFTRTPSGQLISMRQGAGGTSTNSYYFTDVRGSVLDLTNAAGTTDVATYTYDPYGNALTASGTLSTTNPYRFGSGYFDSSTGNTKLGARYYNSTTARFTQLDPSGQEANSYAYANCDPTSLDDPEGTDATAFKCAAAGGVIAVGAAFLLPEIELPTLAAFIIGNVGEHVTIDGVAEAFCNSVFGGKEKGKIEAPLPQLPSVIKTPKGKIHITNA